MALVRARAELLAGIRRFFEQAGVLEVETPACSFSASTDPVLESFSCRYTGPLAPRGGQLYLHTSPELPMKRLLAAGSGPIYQICKVFRNGESGRLHNPEFTLLEWYRPGFDHQRLMGEVASLVNGLLPEPLAVERISYCDAFLRHLDLDPHTCSVAELRSKAVECGVSGAESMDLTERDGWLDLLLTHRIEPHLGRGRLSFLYDYPASQAALARVRDQDPPVAERFELYMEGVELANGFHELGDAAEQRRRFEHDLQQRQRDGLEPVPVDERFLAALESGLPDCAGVALGIDRLLMRLAGRDHINEVLAFPLARS
jgi:lysyl-tRNA synthetase class 2